MMKRRDMLKLSATSATGLIAVSALGLKNSAAAATYSISPVMTEGPFCLDLGLLRSDVRSDSKTGVLTDGFPLLLTLTVSTLNSDGTISPVKGAYVDIWHCNALGYYSGETNNGMYDATAVDWLRGYQVSNSRGQVKFTSIYPGWYAGRTAHIHTRVRLFSDKTTIYDQATQMFFDDNLTTAIGTSSPYLNDTQTRTYNSNDYLYVGASDYSSIDGITSGAGAYLLPRVTKTDTHVSAAFNLIIATAEGVRSLSCPTSPGSSSSSGPGFGGTPPSGTPPDMGGTPPTGTPPIDLPINI